MSTIPKFLIDADKAIDLKLKFTGLTNFSIALGDWNAAASKWIPRTPYVASNQLSHQNEDYPDIARVAAKSNLLLVVSLSMTSLGGADKVATVAQLYQGSTLKGELSTPEASPGANQTASVTMQMMLTGV